MFAVRNVEVLLIPVDHNLSCLNLHCTLVPLYETS